MVKILSLVQIVLSILVIIFILLQNRGEGLAGVFGGLGEFYATRRGLEKLIFWLTFVLVGLLALSTLFNLFLV